MSSGSESDDEYVPGEPEKVSEEESADDETDLQFEKELENKSNKRKSTQSGKGKKKKRKNISKDVSTDSNDEADDKRQVAYNLGDPEKEKKRQDDLWEKFLEGTNTKPKTTTKDLNDTQTVVKNTEPKKDKNVKEAADDKEREKRIFEFAGETIVVENNTIKEKIKTAESTDKVPQLDGPSRSRGGGLSNLLGQLNKKNQLSTLEKSKLDWNTYKKVEGIEEEIVNHNKGKAGYLERRDFLDRTDVRQYELERDLRTSKRSNR